MENNLKINFKDGDKIDYKLCATGEKSVTCVSNNILNLMHGRIYYVPVDQEFDSDENNFRILSNVADKIQIQYIKDQMACVIPIQHNIGLENGEIIAKI